MAERGGQLGNNNPGKNKPWRESIDRALKEGDGRKLRRIADKLVALAEAGESWAVKELADRLDGKSAQSITVSGDADNPLMITEVVRTVKK